MAFNLDRLRGDAIQDDFEPTNGQTVFALSQEPRDPNDAYMLVNQVVYTPPEYFTISGTTATWLNVFALDNTDTVRFVYFI